MMDIAAPPEEDLRQRLKRRCSAFFDGLQRWQNLTSAMIALAAAAWAWQYTQRQINVAQEQLIAAQTQAAIARSELLARRLADLEQIRRQIVELGIGEPFHVYTSILRNVEGPRRPDMETRRREMSAMIRDLEQSIRRVPQTPAIVAVSELASDLRMYEVLDAGSARLPESDEDQRNRFRDILSNRKKITGAKFQPTEKLLSQEINVLTTRIVELETDLR